MPETLRRLAGLARGILPAECAVAASDPRIAYPMRDAEAAQTAGMVPRRRAEFSAGRAAAGLAMADLGLPPGDLLQGTDRAPVWPEGVVGSITHCEDACLAAVSRGLRGIGIDLERNRPLAPELHALIRAPGDRVIGSDGGDDGMRLFCAKEAAYKAQYAVSRQLFGPEVLEMRITPWRFAATFVTGIGPFAAGTRLEGRVMLSGDHILAACWL